MQKRQQKTSHRKWIRTLRNKKRSERQGREVRNGYLFLLPSLLGTGGFVLIPFMDVVKRSFQQAVGSGFVGMENYRMVVENEAFRLAAGNTARFMAVCLPLLLVLSLGTAVLVGHVTKFQRWMKTGFLLPMAIPAASVVVFFQMVFDEKGWLGQLVGIFGITGRDWLASDSAFWILVACYIWKNLGYDMILWLAGLGVIPKEQYEAAKTAGASGFQCLLYITFPQIKPGAAMIGMLSFVNAFRVFREAYLIAGEYPHESIYMLQHLFNNWFTKLDIQKMSAAAVMLAAAVGALILFAITRQEDDE